MYYDLHIHSALSPCSNDDMTLNNIVNMAYIKGLDLIAVTDHNSLKQLSYLSTVAKGKVHFVYGTEIQTREEVHVLAYFLPDTNLQEIQQFLDIYLIEEPNDEDYFGHQYIFNDQDEIIGYESRLLIKSLDLSLKEVIAKIHHFHGIAVLAHALSKRYSIMHNMLTIDPDLDFDGIEVTSEKQKKQLLEMFPFLKEYMIFISSDAHCLEDINEPLYELNKEDFYELWRKRYG